MLVAVLVHQQYAVLQFHRHSRDAQHERGRRLDVSDVAYLQ